MFETAILLSLRDLNAKQYFRTWCKWIIKAITFAMQNLHMDAEKSDTVIRDRLNKIKELSEILKNSDRFIEKISQRFKWNAESRSQNEVQLLTRLIF